MALSYAKTAAKICVAGGVTYLIATADIFSSFGTSDYKSQLVADKPDTTTKFGIRLQEVRNSVRERWNSGVQSTFSYIANLGQDSNNSKKD